MTIPFEFTRPWLFAIAVPILALVAFYFFRSLSDFPKWQRIVSLVVRSAVVLLLGLALAGFTLLHRTNEQFVVFVADQSQSVGNEAAEKAKEFMAKAKEYQGANRSAYLPFAVSVGSIQDEPVEYGNKLSLLQKTGNLANESNPANESTESQELAGSPSAREKTKRNGTNLAAAIEAAAGYIPPGYVPHLVVLSDGNETLSDAVAAASRSRVRISTVPLPTRTEPEVQVSQVNVPAEVREGEPFFVEVSIQSNHDDEGLIEVFRGDHKVVSESRPINTGLNQFRFQQSIERDRLAAFTVRVSGLKQDTFLDNNAETGLVYAAGKPRVLIIESDPNLIRELAYALEDEGIQVDIRPPQGMPDSLADLQNYELLMLSNVPATSITQQQMEIARTYVQELGGGFIMLGGELSFGLGGYYKT
ncbi:MAG: chloride channel protein, partial [Pirellula sp.]